MENIYDVLIIGGGPGGMTAGIYAKRAGLNVAIIEKGMPGGAIVNTPEVSNYTGFTKIDGFNLATKMFEHVNSLDIPVIFEEVKTLKLSKDIKEVICYENTYETRSVILAFGASVRKLNVEGEQKLLGKGVSYCATCDGALYKGENVALVGGGNTALEDALYLSNLAKKVYLIHRRDEFRGEEYLSKQVRDKENIELVLNSVVSRVSGESKIESIEVTNKETKQTQTLIVDGLFVCIGRGPDTDIIEDDIKKDASGYIVTDEYMRTNIEGVFAIGDIRNTPLRQIVTACSDGAIAATKAFEYVLRARKK